MRVLALNGGSSSLKIALFAVEGERAMRRIAWGLVERIGQREASVRFVASGGRAARDAAEPSSSEPPASAGRGVLDHAGAVGLAVAWLTERGLAEGIVAAGHRVVHGGPRFGAPVVVDDDVLVALEALVPLAPLHNPPALAALRAARDPMAPHMPHVATFDTAFHSAMPERAARYAIDIELADRHAIRRYGFHGLAHRSLLERYATQTGRDPRALRVVTLHMGNGCSAAAIRDARSIDTTMGLTPLEGLVMGTRAGDVDAALVGHLVRHAGLTVEDVEQLLNHRSGLLGLSGRSSDMRDVLAAEAAGDPRAALAVELFCYRARKTVGAYLAALGGADAIVFGGGIGAHAPSIRARTCAGLEWAGIHVDAERNATPGGHAGEGTVSPAGTSPHVHVAAVDEEAAIARDALLHSTI